MNKVTLTGRLTRDPEIRYTQAGKAVASFTLAVDRFRSQAQAEKTADFIPIVAWDKLAELCGNYLTKGQKVLVEGRLQIRSYETNDGQKRWVTEVIITDMEFLEKKSASQNYDPGRNPANESSNINSFGKDVFPDEEIPF
jgi:single-strand DNA-binding protein